MIKSQAFPYVTVTLGEFGRRLAVSSRVTKFGLKLFGDIIRLSFVLVSRFTLS